MCLAALTPPGCASSGEPALWDLPDTTTIDASTQTVEIAVHRVECASGVTGEVLPLDVEEGEAQVVITAAVAHNHETAADCKGNEPVLVTLGDLTDSAEPMRWSH